MTDAEMMFLALCIMPMVTIAVCIFACELRIQYREGDTRRYPRYGQSDAMRTKGKSRIKKQAGDNET